MLGSALSRLAEYINVTSHWFTQVPFDISALWNPQSFRMRGSLPYGMLVLPYISRDIQKKLVTGWSMVDYCPKCIFLLHNEDCAPGKYIFRLNQISRLVAEQ